MNFIDRLVSISYPVCFLSNAEWKSYLCVRRIAEENWLLDLNLPPISLMKQTWAAVALVFIKWIKSLLLLDACVFNISYNMVVLLSYLINMKTSWSNLMLFIVFCYPIWLIMVIYPTSDKWSWCSTTAISSWTAVIEGVLLPVCKSQQEIWPGGRK